jgi:nicotinate-nucleotide--dimethylbenzimidazole phosphoribosyltransferase
MKINFAKPIESSSAFQRYNRLTMPPGALERAFQPVLRILAQKPSSNYPYSLRFATAVFAGDHGVAKNHGVSAFPTEVTGQMVINFMMGGAAMSVLSRNRGAHLYVVDVGVANSYEKPPQQNHAKGTTFLNKNIACGKLGKEHYPIGARDITMECALSEDAFQLALQVGREVVEKSIQECNPDIIMLGEMGIGNTTPSTAIICQTLGISPSTITGPGTGINSEQKAQKTLVIQKALQRHTSEFGTESQNPYNIIRSLGGFELAAIAGAAECAAQHERHILMDGTIATASMLPFALKYPEFKSWIIAAHMGSEPAHQAAIAALQLQPLLNLDLRLGEGSGAALAAGIMSDSLTLLNEMATFEAAGVSNKS